MKLRKSNKEDQTGKEDAKPRSTQQSKYSDVIDQIKGEFKEDMNRIVDEWAFDWMRRYPNVKISQNNINLISHGVAKYHYLS